MQCEDNADPELKVKLQERRRILDACNAEAVTSSFEMTATDSDAHPPQEIPQGILDHIAAAVGSMSSVENEVVDLQRHLECFKQEQHNRMSMIQQDLQGLFEKKEFRMGQIVERVQKAAELVQAERCKREALQHNCERRLEQLEQRLDSYAMASSASPISMGRGNLASPQLDVMIPSGSFTLPVSERRLPQELAEEHPESVRLAQQMIASCEHRLEEHLKAYKMQLSDVLARLSRMEAAQNNQDFASSAALAILRPPLADPVEECVQERLPVGSNASTTLPTTCQESPPDVAPQRDPLEASLKERQQRDSRQQQARQDWLVQQTRHIADFERKLTERRSLPLTPSASSKGFQNYQVAAGLPSPSLMSSARQISPQRLVAASPLAQWQGAMSPRLGTTSPVMARTTSWHPRHEAVGSCVRQPVGTSGSGAPQAVGSVPPAVLACPVASQSVGTPLPLGPAGQQPAVPVAFPFYVSSPSASSSPAKIRHAAQENKGYTSPLGPVPAERSGESFQVPPGSKALTPRGQHSVY